MAKRKLKIVKGKLRPEEPINIKLRAILRGLIEQNNLLAKEIEKLEKTLAPAQKKALKRWEKSQIRGG